MIDFKLKPIDILVQVDESNTPLAVIRRWALGSPYSHVLMYLGRWQDSPPFIYESIGRGVILRTLSCYYGQQMVVMRLRLDESAVVAVQNQALAIANDPKSYYDYFCILEAIIPRLICQKLGLPLPLKYHRNQFMVCSEGVAEPFWRASLEVLPQDEVPLPGDFLGSPLLEEVIRGNLCPEWAD